MPLTPEQQARQTIDANLRAAGWLVQDRSEANIRLGRGVAIREFKLDQGHGYADYLLFVDGRAVGVLEAKRVGEPLLAHERQAERYSAGLPASLTAPVRPLPFLYLSNGVETKFVNLLDPDARTRDVFAVHQPETLAEWLVADTLHSWVQQTGAHTAADDSQPSTLRGRLRAMPELPAKGLYPNQVRAITNLERSFRENRPRSLVQMATGSGKTITAVASIYRLIKFGGARRVLFLVDRTNLGEQAQKEFENFRTPDDNRKFTELYNVQRLTSQTVGASTKVVITTIQRLFSILRGDPEFLAENEEGSPFVDTATPTSALPVSYNRSIPPELFDVVFIDECQLLIYSLWRQVLEYFDSFLVGLTATPAAHTYGFFQQNLVMECRHEDAVADGVNVDFEVYRIRTRIAEQRVTIDAANYAVLGIRERRRTAKHRRMGGSCQWGSLELWGGGADSGDWQMSARRPWLVRGAHAQDVGGGRARWGAADGAGSGAYDFRRSPILKCSLPAASACPVVAGRRLLVVPGGDSSRHSRGTHRSAWFGPWWPFPSRGAAPLEASAPDATKNSELPVHASTSSVDRRH